MITRSEVDHTFPQYGHLDGFNTFKMIRMIAATHFCSHRSDSRRSSLTDGNLHFVKRLLLHQNMNIIRGREKARSIQTATCSISPGQAQGPVCAKG